jgi:tetratricopeptide (TPR) repeat protein
MPETFAASRQCLERAIVDDPQYASAHSALALLYSDMARYGMKRDGLDGDPLARALDLAKEAVALEPRATHGFKALHLVYWLMHRTDDSFAAARAGLDLNPNDTELLADLATRLCVTGRWDEGFPMLQQALARNPALGDFYRIVPFLKLFKESRYEEALAEAQRIHLPRLLDGPLATAAAAAELGRSDLAATSIAKVLELDPGFPDHAAAYLANRGLYRDLSQQLIDSWRKAGMKIAEDAR